VREDDWREEEDSLADCWILFGVEVESVKVWEMYHDDMAACVSAVSHGSTNASLPFKSTDSIPSPSYYAEHIREPERSRPDGEELVGQRMARRLHGQEALVGVLHVRGSCGLDEENFGDI
jgi:hypothetical protein